MKMAREMVILNIETIEIFLDFFEGLPRITYS